MLETWPWPMGEPGSTPHVSDFFFDKLSQFVFLYRTNITLLCSTLTTLWWYIG